MNFQETQEMIEQLDAQDGFSPADLLDFPSPVVAILRNLMSRRVKDLASLSAKLKLQSDQVTRLLDALVQKGLVNKIEEGDIGRMGYEVCLKA